MGLFLNKCCFWDIDIRESIAIQNVHIEKLDKFEQASILSKKSIVNLESSC